MEFPFSRTATGDDIYRACETSFCRFDMRPLLAGDRWRRRRCDNGAMFAELSGDVGRNVSAASSYDAAMQSSHRVYVNSAKYN